MDIKKEKGSAPTLPNSKKQSKNTTLLKQLQINEVKTTLINAKKAINYFDFKTKFAKNKSYHVKNINYLIDLYNLLENPKPVSQIIDALLLELYLHKVLEIKNTHFAIKNIASIIEYPENSILNVEEIIKANIIFNRMKSPYFKISNIIETINVVGVKDHLKEILNLLNQDIQWKS